MTSNVGRPKGLPKTGGRKKGSVNKETAELRAIAQAYNQRAIHALILLAETAESELVRLKAWQEILDRGNGKPSQEVALMGANRNAIEVDMTTKISPKIMNQFTNEQLEALDAFARTVKNSTVQS